MLRLIITYGWLLSVYRWGDWRNWKVYYPTVLFFIAGDLLYNFWVYNYPLWEACMLNMNITISTLFSSLATWTLPLFLYLSRFPENNLIKKFLYIIAWSLMFTAVEGILLIFGYFRYSNGWNLWYSFLFDLGLFLK